MKARKKLSIMLSALLTLNLMNGSLLKANAAELTNVITLKSVSVSEKLVAPGSEVKVTVEASDSSANLNKDAYAVYVSKSSGSEVEKEVALAMDDNDKKYHASISIKDPAEAGDWKLSFVSIGDEAGNAQIFYNSNVHQELGQDLSTGDFKVIVDNDAPKLGDIVLNSHDLFQGSNLNVQINATDFGVGLSDEANLVFVAKTDKGDVEKSLTLKLNGGKYEGNLYIDETYPTGDWKLSFVTLEDRAGNVSIIYNSNVHGSELGIDLSAGNFSVKPDTEAPKFVSISVDKKLVKSGDRVNVAVVANDGVALAKEANLCYVMKTDKGDVEKGITLNLVNGKYQGILEVDNSFTTGTLSASFVTLEDALGNLGIVYNSKVHSGMAPEISADMSAGDITVDMVNPDKPVIAVSTEAPTNKNVTVTLTTNEPHGRIDYKLEGQSGWTTYIDKFIVTNNTTVYAKVYDLAGNVSDVAEKKITNIDKVAPVITVTGVENGQIYSKIVKPVISTDDVDATVVTTLNDASYDGKALVEEGSYILKVTATDKVGNVSEKVVSFKIDKTAPTITINGVVDGKIYNTDVKPEIVVNGKEFTITALLNDKPFNSGDKITAEGNYKLVVTVVDGFNRSYEVVKNFTIDKTKPVITVSGVKDNSFYKDKVNIGITTNEHATVAATLNGKDLASNEIAGEGAYTLVVTAVDDAGNMSLAVYNFAIDKTAPVINVLGLQDGGLYNNNVNPVVKVDDVNVNTTVISLNSKLYDGKPITAEGSYEFKVIATDKAGNASEAIYKFKIDKTAPVITIDGIEDGKTYLSTSVVPTIKVNEDAKVTVTLDGKAYSLGSSIETLGEHKLTVTAVDNAGNISKKDVKFSIQVSIPKDAGKAADTVKDLVNNSKQDKVVLNATENPVIDAKVLEAIKGIDKPVSVVVESQGITLTWTFNGKDIKDTTKSVDLTLNAAAPNKDLITKVDSNAQIISFKNHGTLPAPMTITIPVDTKKFDVTKPLYFYYYNETTKKAELIAEGLKAYQKGDAYFVDVTITHCSDYFLSSSDSKTVLPKVEKLVQTGSPMDMNVLLALGMLLIGAGFTVVLARRKRS